MAAELVQDRERRFVVADQHGLGDLELQPARRQAGGGQRRDHLQRQRAALELHRRDVDGEADVVGPFGGFHAGRGQNPFAELVDQAGFFGDRHEIRRRNHAAHGMAPAHQRFAAGDAVVLQAEARLVVDLEAAVRDRLAQIQLQRAARPDLRVHVRLEEAIGAPAGGLGRIHRQIGVLQDLVEIGAVLRRQRDADRGIRGDLMAEALVGRADRLEDAVDEIDHLGGIADAGLHDGELVAAEAGDEIRFSCGAAAQAVRHRFQQFVADRDGRANR